MKATLAILATSLVTAVTLYIRSKRRRKETKVIEGTFERLHGGTSRGT